LVCSALQGEDPNPMGNMTVLLLDYLQYIVNRQRLQLHICCQTSHTHFQSPLRSYRSWRRDIARHTLDNLNHAMQQSRGGLQLSQDQQPSRDRQQQQQQTEVDTATKRQAAREVIDILHEISILLVCEILVFFFILPHIGVSHHCK